MLLWLQSKLTLVLSVACALLLLGLLSVSLYASNRATKVGELEGSLASLQTKLDEANKSLEQASESATVTDEVVTENSMSNDIAETKTLINVANVSVLANKRASNEITDAQFKSALSNRMWDAYCSASADKNDSACTSRKSPVSVQGR